MIPIAFSARCTEHVSNASNALITYDRTLLESDFWDGTRFTAPRDGVYFFSISFVKDAYYHDGTEDDVYVHLCKNNEFVGFAWSGQGTGKRGTGALSLTLHLKQNDVITPKTDDDESVSDKRHISEAYITGFGLY